MNFSNFRKCSLCCASTPIHPLSNISKKLGYSIFVKRDDLNGSGFGGNKLRKLEYIMQDALDQNARVVITYGSLQTNHGLLTAISATRLGLKCILILMLEDDSAFSRLSGNLLLDELTGCSIELLDVRDIMSSALTPGEKDLLCQNRLSEQITQIKEQYKALFHFGNKDFYFIPSAGSTPIGTLGYVDCMKEIISQTTEPFDYIFCGMGSGGTYAGLWLGNQYFKQNTQVIGICIEEMAAEKPGFIANLIRQCAAKIEFEIFPEESDFLFLSNAVNKGYAVPDEETWSVIRHVVQTEGFFLDPVYTGKIFNGAFKYLTAAKPPKNSRVLILHSGGLPGLFNENMADDLSLGSSLLGGKQ